MCNSIMTLKDFKELIMSSGLSKENADYVLGLWSDED